MSTSKSSTKVTKKVVAKKAPATKVATTKANASSDAAFKRPRMKEAVKKTDLQKRPSKTKRVEKKDGIVFPDPGFHIAVLGALLDMKKISAELIQSTLEGLDFDEDSSETERLLAAMARLHTLKMDPADLAQIDTLDFDGGNMIYMLLEDGAETETGGEDDTYCLLALTGIAALSGLKYLSLDGHGYREEKLDLKPLEGHPALETLILTGKCKSARALETMPNLARVDVRLGKVDVPSALDRLEKRGVEVRRST